MGCAASTASSSNAPAVPSVVPSSPGPAMKAMPPAASKGESACAPRPGSPAKTVSAPGAPNLADKHAAAGPVAPLTPGNPAKLPPLSVQGERTSPGLAPMTPLGPVGEQSFAASDALLHGSPNKLPPLDLEDKRGVAAPAAASNPSSGLPDSQSGAAPAIPSPGAGSTKLPPLSLGAEPRPAEPTASSPEPADSKNNHGAAREKDQGTADAATSLPIQKTPSLLKTWRPPLAKPRPGPSTATESPRQESSLVPTLGWMGPRVLATLDLPRAPHSGGGPAEADSLETGDAAPEGSPGDDGPVAAEGDGEAVQQQQQGHAVAAVPCSASEDGHAVATVQGDGKAVVAIGGRPPVAVVPEPFDMGLLQGHTSYVNGCAVTPDGLTVVTASDDKTVRVWDARTRECRQVLEGHSNWVRCCAVTADGSKVVSGSDDKTVRVWDLLAGECSKVLKGHSNKVFCCALSPDGSAAVSGGMDMALRVWNLLDGECTKVLKGHTNWVWCCTFTPDGSAVVSGSKDAALRVWDTETGECTRILAGHTNQVLCCAVTPDGSKVVSGSKETLQWDLQTGESAPFLEGHTNTVGCCAVTPDGSTAITSSFDKTLRVWDMRTGECRRVLEGHSNQVLCCTNTADGGTTVISAEGDGNSLKVLDLRRARAACCACSCDGKVAAFVLGDLPEGSEPDAATVSTSLMTIQLPQEECSDDGTGQQMMMRSLLQCGPKAWVSCCFADPFGETLVAAAADGTLLVTRDPHTLDGPASSEIWRSSAAETAELRCLAACQPVSGGGAGKRHPSPDIYIAVGHSNGTVEIWRTTPPNDRQMGIEPRAEEDAERVPAIQLHTLEDEHASPAITCSFSPDAALLITGTQDSTLCVWDVQGGDLRATLKLDGGLGPLLSAALPADDVLVTCQQRSSSLTVWHLGLGVPVVRLSRPAGKGQAEPPRPMSPDAADPGVEFASAAALLPSGAVLTVNASTGDVETWRPSKAIIDFICGWLPVASSPEASPAAELLEAALSAQDGCGLLAEAPSLLLLAAAGGRAPAVKRILQLQKQQESADLLSSFDSKGNSALQRALQRGAWDMFFELMEHASGGVLEKANLDEETLMHSAVASGAPRGVTIALAKAGCGLDRKDEGGRTPLELAAERGDVEMLARLGGDIFALNASAGEAADPPQQEEADVAKQEEAAASQEEEADAAQQKTEGSESKKPPTVKELQELVQQMGEARASGSRQRFMQLINDESSSPAAFLVDEQGMSQLHHAAADNTLNLLAPLLKVATTLRFSLDAPSRPASETPLHVASHHGNLDSCRTLIAYGASAHATQQDGKTAAHLASAEKHTAVVEFLVQSGCDLDVLSASGCTALMEAVQSKDEETCTFLLEVCAANPNAWSAAAGSPLHQAFRDGSLALARLLVGHGATSIKGDHLGNSGEAPELLLHLAVQHDETDPAEAQEFVRLAAQAMDDLETKDFDGRTALLLAMEMDKWELCELLLEEGVSPDTAGPNGDSPLHIAARKGNEGFVAVLHRFGADPDPLNSQMTSPLYEALLSSSPPAHVVAEALIKAGAELDFVQGHKGDTLLHLVANSGDEEGVELLISGGADMLATNNQGLTAADMAATVELNTRLENPPDSSPPQIPASRAGEPPGGPGAQAQAREQKQQQRRATLTDLQTAREERKRKITQAGPGSDSELSQQPDDTCQPDTGPDAVGNEDEESSKESSKLPEEVDGEALPEEDEGNKIQAINGRFTLIESSKRFQGSTGEVVFALDIKSEGQPTVAVKIFKQKELRDHCAEMLQTLTDTKFVATLLPGDLSGSVFDEPVMSTDVQHALVTAAGGGALAGCLSKLMPGDEGRSLGLRRVAAVMYDLLQCADYIHSHRLVHCNLCAANAVHFSDGRYRLVGLEEARRFGDNVTGAATAAVCAPEAASSKQLCGKQCQASPALDIWALGCIMWRMVTGAEFLQSLFPEKQLGNNEEQLALLAAVDQADVDRLLGGLAQTQNSLKQAAANMMGRMLVVEDPSRRCSAKDLLEHEFLADNPARLRDLIQQSSPPVPDMQQDGENIDEVAETS